MLEHPLKGPRDEDPSEEPNPEDHYYKDSLPDPRKKKLLINDKDRKINPR